MSSTSRIINCQVKSENKYRQKMIWFICSGGCVLVCFSFVCYFLCSMTTDLIKERITELGIVSELTGGIGESTSAEMTTKFIARMHKNVYPLISGTDQDRLIYFYSLLADCKTSDNSSQNHVKLLRKLKSTVAGSRHSS